jgi:hypothetical protein
VRGLYDQVDSNVVKGRMTGKGIIKLAKLWKFITMIYVPLTLSRAVIYIVCEVVATKNPQDLINA